MVSCPDCNEQFGSDRSLRRHCELYESHKVKSRPRAAEVVVKEFLNCEEVNRPARLKYLMKELPLEFLCENIIPYIAKHITLYEFLIQKMCCRKKISVNQSCVLEITEMLQKVNKKFLQVHSYAYQLSNTILGQYFCESLQILSAFQVYHSCEPSPND